MAEHSRMMNFHSSILQVASIIKNNELRKSGESSDFEKKKRERHPNYTQEEADRLVDLILPKKDILENKKGGADQWNEKKLFWEEIERDFNKNRNQSSTYRDSKTLKFKYESLRKDVKRKWSHFMTGNTNSDGTLPKLSVTEKKIAEIMELPLEEGFCDFIAINDHCEADGSDDSRTSDDKNTNEYINNRRASELIEKHIDHSDDDDDHESCETYNDNPESRSLNVDEPPSKKICQDPLIDHKYVVPGKQNNIDNRLEMEKLEIIKKKKYLIDKEILEKELKIKMIQDKMEQNKVLFDLQKKRILMEIEAIKKGYHLEMSDDDIDF